MLCSMNVTSMKGTRFAFDVNNKLEKWHFRIDGSAVKCY